MPERMDERDLERTLSELGERLAYPAADVWPAVRARIAERRTLPWWTRLATPRFALAPVAATLAVMLVAALLLTPNLAAEAARVLGLPGAQIFRVPQTPAPTPAGAAPTFGGQRALSLADATRIAGFTVKAPAELGEPDAIYVETAPVRVTLVYRSRPGIPVSPVAGVSAIVVEFRGALEQGVMGKTVGPQTQLETVPLASGTAYWLSGAPHEFFYRDPAGNLLPESLRLAGNTLLWEAGGITYRLEASLSKEEAVRIASTLR
jgi:hypothetical protein